MTDRYVPVILSAIDGLKDAGLEVETDEISTFLGGDRNAIWSALERVFARAARTGEHVVMAALISHGCPGEAYCEPDPLTGTARAATTHDGKGVPASAQWSLYPLGAGTYMDVIYSEIARTKQSGVFSGGAHFVSKLDGDVCGVLDGVRGAFDDACGQVSHVVAHVTLSANSPTKKKGTSI
ncbi:MAG: hypothetical protein HY071_00105 [Chloroflexi bacterium]|nr:hypothetical protein [Chloroflexota bacterium]